MVQNNEYTITLLSELIEKGRNISASADGYGYVNQPQFDSWRAEILTILRYTNLDIPEYVHQIQTSKNRTRHDVNAVNSTLRTIIDQLNKGILEAKQSESNPDEQLKNIFDRFHKIARQLRTRHDSRCTLEINDEYDVQDLLHALLQLHFDDIRPEEWTPSYAGGSVRMDFLLKSEGIVIEVKKTRDSMTAKTLGEELLIDREKYKVHPDCKKLYCFVYDPEGRLGNPMGIKSDLEKDAEGFIRVYIRPEY